VGSKLIDFTKNTEIGWGQKQETKEEPPQPELF